ncbi:MAG: bifunctional 4-hydroxy-2-oxoglutarate aldolase/2-dehydro-3-deoxy-phosphogluconate aldolase [Planctomycetota bacterium]
MSRVDAPDTIAKHRLLPVIALRDSADAAPLGEALLEGGLPVAEVTFRTDAAAASIDAMCRLGGLLVGAGTVVKPDQVDAAHDAGASFIVSPGTSPAVVERAQKLGLPIFPGVATPTDIQLALSLGLDTLKFFPAEAMGGVNTLKALAAPFPGVRFVPTGGIGLSNIDEYLSLPCVRACGGSWMVAPKLYAHGGFAEVVRVVRQAVTAVAGSN